jgi:hypothetical protein
MCKAAPGIVSLSTARGVDGSGPGPDMWLCAACLDEGINSPEAQALQQADEDMERHRDGGGHLN